MVIIWKHWEFINLVTLIFMNEVILYLCCQNLQPSLCPESSSPKTSHNKHGLLFVVFFLAFAELKIPQQRNSTLEVNYRYLVCAVTVLTTFILCAVNAQTMIVCACA